MKTVGIENAVGHVLAHDLTQIIRGSFKGSRFKKGHVIVPEDIPVLKSMGKLNLYVLELDGGRLHENDAARIIAECAKGSGVTLSEPNEGKIDFFAEFDGLLKIDEERLLRLLEEDDIMFASLRGDRLVSKGEKIAGTRVIPLVVEKKVGDWAREVLTQPLIYVKPLKKLKIGLVTTGSEIKDGLIKDTFGPVMRDKFSELGCDVTEQLFPGDDAQAISDSIKKCIQHGAEMVAVTGGMSVDPDDRTPAGIRLSGADVVSYGAPVLPGAMFMLAYFNDIPVVGLPGCVMFARRTVFDLIVPRIVAGERPTKQDIKKLAQGGLCRGCEDCTFPRCGFGA